MRLRRLAGSGIRTMAQPGQPVRKHAVRGRRVGAGPARDQSVDRAVTFSGFAIHSRPRSIAFQ